MRKVQLTLLSALIMLFLTGCGASVSSELKLNEDGSGKRVVSAVISNQDEGNIMGGFDALEKVLKQKAPEGIKISRTNNPKKNQVVFRFQYNFSSIEEYNDKTSQIFKCKSDAKLNFTCSLLKTTYNFHQTDNLSDIIAWATSAVDEAKIIAGDQVCSNCYYITGNKITFARKKVFEGVGKDPNFEMAEGATVSSVNVYSEYDLAGGQKKKIDVILNKSEYNRLDKIAVERYLRKYAPNIEHNDEKSGFTVTLTNQEQMKSFFDQAGMNTYSGQGIESEFRYCNKRNSIFGVSFLVKEKYSLAYFLNEFNMKNEMVNYYVLLPKMIYSEECSFDNIKKKIKGDSYQFSGKQAYNSVYYIEFKDYDRILFKKINADYKFNNDFSGKLITQIEFYKNGREMNEQIVRKEYQNLKDNLIYSEKGDIVTLTFEKEIVMGGTQYQNGTFAKRSKMESGSKKNIVENIDISYYISDYLDVNYLENCIINYKIEIQEAAGIIISNLDGTAQYPDEIKKSMKNNKYIFTQKKEAVMPFMASFTVSSTNYMYYVSLVENVFLILLGTSVLILLCVKRKRNN